MSELSLDINDWVYLIISVGISLVLIYILIGMAIADIREIVDKRRQAKRDKVYKKLCAEQRERILKYMKELEDNLPTSVIIQDVPLLRQIQLSEDPDYGVRARFNYSMSYELLDHLRVDDAIRDIRLVFKEQTGRYLYD